MQAAAPTGIVTLMFTDLEGSTELWERLGDAFHPLLERHNALVRAALERWEGYEVKTEGDAFMVAFASAGHALACALEIQREIEGLDLRVRIGLHTGEPLLGFDPGGRPDYYGPVVNRAARVAAAGHGGQTLLSGPTRELVTDALPAGLDLADCGRHRLKGLEQPERLWELRHPDLPTRDYPPLRTLDAVRTNLPAPLTTFIGREDELAQLASLLQQPDTRLVTLTGSGGCGKTRLAVRLGAELLGEYADGVWLVELAPLGEPTLVPQAIAAAVGVREEPGRALPELLAAQLQPRRLLLLLDNCEHLLAAAAEAAAGLLAHCPHLRVVATSREPLGLGGERVFRVPSLQLPERDPVPPPQRLAQYDAVRLFIDRAQLSQPDFQVTSQNAPAVAEVCARLDGIPLAIELAAARVQSLKVEQIAARLDDRFRLLTGGSRSALPRQQTLRAAIEWSYRLLSDEEQAMLERLSVFAGGWDLAAAEALSGAEGFDPWAVLDLLAALVDKSLVVYDEEAARYRLLETVRQFSAERLQTSERGPRLRQSHAHCYAARARTVYDEPAERRTERNERVAADLDNYRLALAWCQAQESEADCHQELFETLAWYWIDTGKLSEAAEAATQAVASLHGATPLRQARTRSVVAWVANSRCEAARAEPCFRQAAEELITLGQPVEAVRALQGLGYCLRQLGRVDEMVEVNEQAIGLARACGADALLAELLRSSAEVLLSGAAAGHERARAALAEAAQLAKRLNQVELLQGCRYSLGVLAWRSREHVEAEAHFQEAWNLACREGMATQALQSLLALADMARVQGQLELARDRFGEALAEARRLERVGQQVSALHNLGYVAWRERHLAEARRLLAAALGLAGASGDRYAVTLCLVRGALVLQAEGDLPGAAELYGACFGLREGRYGSFMPPDCDLYAEQMQVCREAMGSGAYAAAYAAGAALDLPAAVARGLEALHEQSATTGTLGPQSASQSAGHTPADW